MRKIHGLGPLLILVMSSFGTQTSNIEDRLNNKLLNLAEFKNLVRQLPQKDEKAGVRATIIIPTKPTKEKPYYEIWLGYNHPDHFETVYILRLKGIYANKSDIVPHLEIANSKSPGEFLSLLKWRKMNGTK